MPGLERSLIEHRLPIKKGFKPYKQPPRCMSPDLMPQIKEEIQKLLKVGFIRPFRYADWLANIVPVVKKNGNKSGAGILLKGPDGQRVKLQLQLEAMTHNSAEYEALILGLEALIARNIQSVIIRGESQLVINQIQGYCRSVAIKNLRSDN
ncbi:uncharacterized protein LOC127256900 [Andrographis paniculata]|uniref:uncharacterized protein LOC127256900 n=1 Tax=Andrographis paniculata TaxID=175694 RepID=UPI0021E7EE03|nr:uncharacterized protein LOC127256900 [Andrographis paniculata]